MPSGSQAPTTTAASSVAAALLSAAQKAYDEILLAETLKRDARAKLARQKDLLAVIRALAQ